MTIPERTPGVDPSRVARVCADYGAKRTQDRYKLSSGYRISDRLVLTAAHGLRGAEALTVDLDGDGVPRAVTCEWLEEQPADLALLRFCETPASRVTPVRLGRVDRSRAVTLGAEAFGYPSSAVIKGDIADELGEGVWGRVHIRCEIRTAETGVDGTVRVHVLDWAPAAAPDGSSPWQGMSGAAVLQQPDLLLAVFRNQVPASGVSTHQATVLGSVDDADWRAALRAEDIDPAPRTVFPDGWDRTGGSLAPHLVASRRQSPSRGELELVHPGEHDSSPVRILDRLSEIAHSPTLPVGVVVSGEAGAGKSRMCRETAALADSEGWLVVDLTEQATLESVRESVSGLAGRVLVVADDIHSIADDATTVRDVCAEAVASGTELALLTCARPPILQDLKSQPLEAEFSFDEVAVRSDAGYRELINRAMLRKLAPAAVATKGEDYLFELCATAPPEFCRLLATYYNNEVLAGRDLDNAIRIRDGDIGLWLRDVLKDVGVPGLEPYVPPEAATTAVAKIAISVPCALGQAWSFSATAGASVGGTVMERLITLGLLRHADDELSAGHDLYADHLLGQGLLLADWKSVHPRALAEVLGTALADRPALAKAARAVESLREALGGAGDDLGRKFEAWCENNLERIGSLVCEEPKGELLRSLLPLRTWRSVMRRSLAEIWLREHHRKPEALDTILIALSYLAAENGQEYLTGWVDQHAEKKRAGLAFQRIQPTRDLGSGARVMDRMYDYLVHHATRLEASRVLAKLLDSSKPFGLPQGDPRAIQVVGWAQAWLDKYHDRPESGFVARPLMLRPELKGRRIGETGGLLLETVAPRHPEQASFAIEPVLRRQRLFRDVPVPLFKHAVKVALDWLEHTEGYGRQPEAAYLLKELIAPDRAGRDVLPRAVQAAWNWLTPENASRPREPGLVLPPLLRNGRLSRQGTHSALTPEEYAELGCLTVAWLARTEAQRAGRYVEVLGELLQTRLLDDDHELLHEHIELALTLLGERPGPSHARNLLQRLLRKRVDARTRGRLLEITFGLATRYPTNEHTAYPLTSLIERKDLNEAEHGLAMTAVLEWLGGGRLTKPGARKLLAVAFASRHATPEQRGMLAERAVRMLSLQLLAEDKKHSLTKMLFNRRQEIRSDWNRYVARACDLVAESHGHPSATMTALSIMQDGADQLDRPNMDKLHRTCLISCDANGRSSRADVLLPKVLGSRALEPQLRRRASDLAHARLSPGCERREATGGLVLALLRDGDLGEAEALGHTLDIAVVWLEVDRGTHETVLLLARQVVHRLRQDVPAGAARAETVRRVTACLRNRQRNWPHENPNWREAESLRRSLAELAGGEDDARPQDPSGAR